MHFKNVNIITYNHNNDDNTIFIKQYKMHDK